MNYREFEWQAQDGNKVVACEWTPEGPAHTKAVIVIVHGMGEHSGRYHHVAEMLTAEGYAVLAFDQLGHGRTEGRRGHTSSYEDLLDGIDRLLGEASRRFAGKPQVIFGHSMGGNLTLNYLLRRQPKLAGAIVTGPWLKLAFDPPAVSLAVARVLVRLFPSFTNDRPLAANHLTSDPAMAKQLLNDPLGHGKISAKFFFSVRNAGLWSLEHAAELSVPVLLMHGGDDKVTSIHASRQFAEGAGIALHEWPGFRHELHNELGREEVFIAMKQWLKDRLAETVS